MCIVSCFGFQSVVVDVVVVVVVAVDEGTGRQYPSTNDTHDRRTSS